jgi:hypothetical protein
VPSRRHVRWLIFAIAILLAAGTIIFQPRSYLARADNPVDEPDKDKEDAQARKQRFTDWMRTYAEGTNIRVPARSEAEPDEEQLAELVPNPVFRYSDVERAIPDATLWVWTVNGRPAAFQKVEGNNHGGGQAWTICFASLSEELVNVRWPRDRQFAAIKPGVTFSPIPQADAPADNSRARTTQLKALKERFTGRLNVNGEGQGGAATRTMSRPIFEYSDPKTKRPVGAIFGMTSTGTNPDLLLLIEARRDDRGTLRWEYAHARMTSASVRVRLDDAEVWAEPVVDTRNAVFDNWTFYFLPRDFQ